MYIEIRKNAFYLKNSVWDKKTKKTKNSSTYLGSDFTSAHAELSKLVTAESPILKELTKVQEKYAYERAISSLEKLVNDLENTKSGKEITKTIARLTKAQERYTVKSQNNSAIKSQLISDTVTHENLKELEELGQTVLCDDKAQNNM